MSDNMFEVATKLKLRFSTPQGLLSVEDLWDLPLKSNTANRANLNDVARGINTQLKDAAESESFVPEEKTSNNDVHVKTLQVMLDLVKHIIAVKVQERDAARIAREKAETKQKLMSALADAQDASLKSKTPEEIQAMIDAL